jgi:hypothetical protein
VPSVLDIPAELLVLGLRLALIVAIYGFLVIVVREVRRDWKRAEQPNAAAFGLVVTHSGTDEVAVGQVFELRRLSTIGRLPEATIRLNDEHVSARHAEMSRSADGSWLLRDVGSTNGTQLNGKTITGQVPVRAGDLIGLGSSTLRLESLSR